MDAYSRLQSLVAAGQVEIICIYGTARSGTTVLGRLFTGYADLVRNQPFRAAVTGRLGKRGSVQSFTEADFAGACQVILDDVEGKRRERAEPVRIAVKELAYVMPPAFFRQWLSLVGRVVVPVREPFSQVLSLGRAGAAMSLQLDDLPDTTRFLTEHAERIFAHPNEDLDGMALCPYNAKMWAAQEADLAAIASLACVDGQARRTAVLDTTLMRYHPVEALERTLQTLQIDRSAPAEDRDGGSWFQADRFRDARDPDRVTIRRAMRSRTIDPITADELPDGRLLPAPVRAHAEALLPLYFSLMVSPDNCYRPARAEVESRPCFGTAHWLADGHPLLAFFICCLDRRAQADRGAAEPTEMRHHALYRQAAAWGYESSCERWLSLLETDATGLVQAAESPGRRFPKASCHG